MSAAKTPCLVPYICVPDAKAAIDFYVAAVGAEEVMRMPHDDGRVMHAEIKIGDSKMYLSDDFPEYFDGKSRTVAAVGGTSPTSLALGVADCDATVARMAAAGGTVILAPNDAFWGDRFAKVRDPFGYEWIITHPLAKAA